MIAKHTLLALFIIAIGLSNAVQADWELQGFDHRGNDISQHHQSAMVRNSDGFELAIFKTDEGIVWLDFSLSDNNFDTLSINALPRWKIDSHKAVQLTRGFTATIVPSEEGVEIPVVDDEGNISFMRDTSINYIVTERLPERVICPIWQGDDRAHFNTIESLKQGETIHFSYTLSDDTQGETQFSLTGANEAITAALK